MVIVKATASDLIEVMYLLNVCIKDMNNKGMKQWNNTYPDGKLIRNAIDEEKIYTAKEMGVIRGMISIASQIPEEYKSLINNNLSKTLFLQFLAVHPVWRGKGIAKMLIDFAENYAKQNEFNNIKLDVISDDTVNELVLKNKYSEVGKFHSSLQVPYVCYEKTLM